MSNKSNELPIFAASAPAIFCDPDATPSLFTDVLEQLATVADVDDGQLDLPTPCVEYTVRDLRRHVLGWLGFFADALADPAAARPRRDPESFVLSDGTHASEIVLGDLTRIRQAIADDAAGQLVVMSSSRMAGDAVLGMALGEYIVHGWDLAVATSQPYSASESVVAPSLAFLEGMVAPEYRGPDSGFFDNEVSVPEDASLLDKLLGFAGRDPQWRAS